MAGKLSIRLLDSVKMRVGGVFDEPCAMGETSHVVHDQTTQMELAQLKSVMLQAIDHGAETLGMSTDQVKAHGGLLTCLFPSPAEPSSPA